MPRLLVQILPGCLESDAAAAAPGGPGDTTAGRADQLRLVSPHEDLFNELYGLRNDSEAINANYKSTHVYDRAPVLGWRRQLLDLLAWSILINSIAWWYHAPAASEYRIAA